VAWASNLDEKEGKCKEGGKKGPSSMRNDLLFCRMAIFITGKDSRLKVVTQETPPTPGGKKTFVGSRKCPVRGKGRAYPARLESISPKQKKRRKGAGQAEGWSSKTNEGVFFAERERRGILFLTILTPRKIVGLSRL